MHVVSSPEPIVGTMLSFRVVEKLHVAKCIALCQFSNFVLFARALLAGKNLRNDVVVTVSSTAHTAFQIVLFEKLASGLDGVLIVLERINKHNSIQFHLFGDQQQCD